MRGKRWAGQTVRPIAFLSLQIVSEFVDVLRAAQLAQRLDFDLTGALAREAELAPNLFERAHAAVVEAETQTDRPALAVGQALQRVRDLELQQLAAGGVQRRHHTTVLDEVAE